MQVNIFLSTIYVGWPTNQICTIISYQECFLLWFIFATLSCPAFLRVYIIHVIYSMNNSLNVVTYISGKVPVIDNGSRKIVAFSKHLCGAATGEVILFQIGKSWIGNSMHIVANEIKRFGIPAL